MNSRKTIFSLLGIAIICSLCIYEGRDIVTQSVANPLAKIFGAGVKYSDLIAEAAVTHSVHPALIAAVIHAESGFDPMARSRADAKGLMQIAPCTERYLKLKNAYDPRQNVNAGSQYLKELLDRFKGNMVMAIAAYNAGPGAVARHAGIPPYKETRTYVKRVLAYYKQYRKTFSAAPLMS